MWQDKNDLTDPANAARWLLERGFPGPREIARLAAPYSTKVIHLREITTGTLADKHRKAKAKNDE
jgi:hypothetical protein